MNPTLIEKAASGLRNVALELEEFQLQFALGKAETSEKYNQVIGKFHKVVGDAIMKVQQGMRTSGLQTKLEELQVQLALGKAETKEAYNEHSKRISSLIAEVERELENTSKDSELYIELKESLFKFKVKLEILRVHFELGKMDLKDELKEQRKLILRRVDDLLASYAEQKRSLEGGWDQFHKEMTEVYDHLKKAFSF